MGYEIKKKVDPVVAMMNEPYVTQLSDHRFRILRQGVTIELPRHRFLMIAYREVYDLSRRCDCFFSVDAESGVHAHLDGMNLMVETVEDIMVLHEIYVRGIYNLVRPRPFLVMDVGMNVGFTSLFYARRGVAHIVGYEPMRPTLKKAHDNFMLNAEHSALIETCAYGLGGLDSSFEVNYSPSWKSSVGVGGLPDAYLGADDVTKEILSVHEASAEVDRLRLKYPALDLVMKIDCEGSEYDIIERLAFTDRIQQVSFMMIEWHRRRISAGPETILKHLEQAGMTCLLHDPHGDDIGMIYAFKS
jgi:FkbM family methyltransferase